MSQRHPESSSEQPDATATNQTQAQEQALAVVRNEIDRIDREIQRLLNERAGCAQRVAEIKAHFDSQGAVFYRPEREAQVLRAVMARNEGPLPAADVARLFREIMSVCLAHEQPLNVVYTGSAQAEAAAMKQFGHSAHCTAQPDLASVFVAVQQQSADYGVVPLEPLDAPARAALLGLLERFDLTLCGEVALWRHQADDQGSSDTRSAFLVLGRQWVGPSGQDKTGLVMQLACAPEQAPAQLQQWLQGTQLQPVRVITAPAAAAGAAVYLELPGHHEAAEVARLIAELTPRVQACKVLGSFPCAVL